MEELAEAWKGKEELLAEREGRHNWILKEVLGLVDLKNKLLKGFEDMEATASKVAIVDEE